MIQVQERATQDATLLNNDLLEAVIAVPENMFYNTGIGTFIWVLSNKKEARRKGKIQLIDATALKSPLRQNLGSKNCEFTPEIRDEIIRIFMNMEESSISKIFNNNEFGCWSITVERPLRLRVYPEREIPEAIFKTHEEYESAIKALGRVHDFLDDWEKFAGLTRLREALLKKIRPFITERDSNAKPVTGEADPELRDIESVPFTYEGGIEAFMKNEVLPYAPDAYIDETKTQIGYEISFTKYFYRPEELRSMKEILESLNELDIESREILSGLEEDFIS